MEKGGKEMKGLNKVMLIGNLGNDPEVRYTKDETAVANVSIATTLNYKGDDFTEWHKLVFWGSLAEVAGEYLTKGDRVYIEGRIRSRTWEDDEGDTRYTTEIIVRDMVMLSSKKEDKKPSKVKSNGTTKGKGKKSNKNADIPF